MSGSGSILDNLGSNLGQKIDLNDGRPSSIHGLEVFVHQSEQSKLGLQSSAMIRINTMVGQSWQPTGYHGNMIASNRDFLAYVLESRNGYVVRVIQLKTKDRALLKKFSGKICDLSFFHFNSNVLGIVDQAGNVHVYDLDMAQGDVTKIGDSMMIKIMSNAQPDNDLHRLIWCPFVSDEDSIVGDNLIVAVSSGRRAEVYDVKEVAHEYRIGFVMKSKLTIARAYINDAHEGDICDIALSPDGTVLATAGSDGRVKFWRFNLEDTGVEPVCLHNYEPHGGKPVTRILFCDNYLSKDPKNQFWRYLLTATEDNTVIKLWCAVHWKCLQTISFRSPVANPTGPPSKMILTFDLTASYLLIADTTNTVLYVLPLYQEPAISDASFTSITEYLLTQQILSFVITECTPARLSTPFDSSEDDDEEGEGSRKNVFNPKRNAVVIHLHCIQTKSLQELQVRFEPPGIMGIPSPVPTTTNGNKDSGIDKEPLQPPNDGDIPPLMDMHLDDTATSRLNDSFTSLELSGGLKQFSYAPGQSSPSVKLLSPDSIIGTGATPVVSSTSSLSSHVLCSPSDFESLPGKFQLGGASPSTTVRSDNESSLDSSLNSKIVILPLRKVTDNNDDNEEMVITSSPPSSMPVGEGNQPFPSAHDISESLTEQQINEDTRTRNRNESMEDVESWPDLSEESERKSGLEVMDHGNNISPPQDKMPSPPHGLSSQEDVPLSKEDVPINTVTPLSTMNARDLEVVSNSDPATVDISVPSLADTKEIAAIVVANAITAAIGITEKTNKREEELEEKGVVQEMENNVTEVMDEEQAVVKSSEDVESVNNEEDEVEVKSKLVNGDTISHDLSQSAINDDIATGFIETSSSLVMDDTIPDSKQQHLSPSVADDSRSEADVKLLIELVQSQQLELHALKCHTQQAIDDLQSSVRDCFNEFSQSQKSHLSQQLQEHYQRIEKVAKDKPATLEPKKVTQSVVHAVNTSVNSAVAAQMEKCVKNEFKRSVTPIIQRQLTVIQNEMFQTLQQRLSTIDLAVRETLERAINVQSIIDALGGTVASTLHHLTQKNSEALFLNAVLPSFQDALKEIFVQINETFQKGLVEYFSQLQLHEASVQENALRTLHSSLLAPNSPLTQLINATLSQELATVTQQLETSISGSISSVVKSGIEESLSNSNLTQPSVKQQKERIQSLLDDKQYDSAFNLALSTSSLEVVTQTCQMVSPDEVFDAETSESSLTQPVLLSLIQQLAVGLQSEIELKIKYLEMAILSLDPEDPITSPHLPPVMQLLHEQILKVEEQVHSTKGGSPGLFRATKRVRMLASHVKKSSQKS